MADFHHGGRSFGAKWKSRTFRCCLKWTIFINEFFDKGRRQGFLACISRVRFCLKHLETEFLQFFWQTKGLSSATKLLSSVRCLNRVLIFAEICCSRIQFFSSTTFAIPWILSIVTFCKEIKFLILVPFCLKMHRRFYNFWDNSHNAVEAVISNSENLI